jgi:hypothetical protein
MKPVKVGEKLLNRFDVELPHRTDAQLPEALRKHGMQLLEESDNPAQSVMSLPILTDGNFVSNLIRPSYLLQDTAIFSERISEINLATFDAHVDVVADHALRQRRPREAARSMDGDGATRIRDALADQILKQTLNWMFVGGVHMPLRDAVVIGSSTARYALSKPGTGVIKRALRHEGVDITDNLALYEYLTEHGGNELLFGMFRDNPYYSRISQRVTGAYRDDVSKSGDITIYTEYGVSEASAEMNSLNDAGATAKALFDILRRMEKKPKWAKSAEAALAEEFNTTQREMSRLTNQKAAHVRRPTQAVDIAAKRYLARTITQYCERKHVAEKEAWRVFDGVFAMRYGISIRSKHSEHRMKNRSQKTLVEFLALANFITQATAIAEEMLQNCPTPRVNREPNIVITPNF